MHVACLAVLLTGAHTLDFILCGLLYFIRMFGITAGYHRYFAHRTFKTSRPFQFVLAWLGCMSLQKGPLWWAAHHRDHHRYSDTENDPHSPIARGIWWSHLGWVLSNRFDETNWRGIRDSARFPELRWMNAFHWVPGILLGFSCWLIGGFSPFVMSWFSSAEQTEELFSFPCAWSGLIVGFFISTVLLYHGVF